jgi:hypothetical protein
MLLAGCPFNSIDFYADPDVNPDAGQHIIALAITALGKPDPAMQDFNGLFRIKPEQLFDLDDELMKKVCNEDDVDALENRAHNELKSSSKDYGIFRQFAINAASTNPTSLGLLGESVKVAREAAVTLPALLRTSEKAGRWIQRSMYARFCGAKIK